jgi:hypothetical protein
MMNFISEDGEGQKLMETTKHGIVMHEVTDGMILFTIVSGDGFKTRLIRFVVPAFLQEKGLS